MAQARKWRMKQIKGNHMSQGALCTDHRHGALVTGCQKRIKTWHMEKKNTCLGKYMVEARQLATGNSLRWIPAKVIFVVISVYGRILWHTHIYGCGNTVLITCRARAVVEQYIARFKTPRTDWQACLTGAQAKTLCWTVKRANRIRSVHTALRTEVSLNATDQGTDSETRIDSLRKGVEVVCLSARHIIWFHDRASIFSLLKVQCVVFSGI